MTEDQGAVAVMVLFYGSSLFALLLGGAVLGRQDWRAVVTISGIPFLLAVAATLGAALR